MKNSVWILGILLALSFFTACDLEERVPVEMVTINQNKALGNEKALEADIRFDIGSVEISGEKTSSAYSMDLEYDKSSYAPEVNYTPAATNDTARLIFRLESTHKIGIRSQPHRNRLRLGLTNAVPIKLNLNTGVGDARLSLTDVKLSSLDIECGVGGAKISSYEPNPVVCDRIRIKSGVGSMDGIGLGNLNFRELEFEGGIGGASLDLTGKWMQDADLRIQVGVGGVSLRMPRDVGVRVEAEKHFLSGLHLDGFTKRDAHYYSENYDKAKIHVTVRVTTGVGGFRINWV